MKKTSSCSKRSLLAFALLGCFTGCEDEAEISQATDAVVDAAVVDAVVTKTDAGVDAVASDAVLVVTDAQSSGPDGALAEFSWSVDPMSVQLRRGTCRELRVLIKRRADFNDSIALGVGGGPFRVGFSAPVIEAGASIGTIILATPYNAPEVKDKDLLIAATGKATYLRMNLQVTVLDTESNADGGVVEPLGDAGIWNNDTCGQILQGLSTITM
jgi:hypothetical protein